MYNMCGLYYYYCENCAQLSGKNIKRKQNNILFEIIKKKKNVIYLHLCSLYAALRPIEKGVFQKSIVLLPTPTPRRVILHDQLIR